MVVFVATKAWPIFPAQRAQLAAWRRRLRNRGRQADRGHHQPARRGLPPARLAADLRHAADERDRGRAGARDRGALLGVHRRACARAGAPDGDPDGPPARVGPVGHLRADRDPRARAVRRQPHHHRTREGLGAERRAADRRRAWGDRGDPHDDDHADHDRADLRGARLGAAVVARGSGGAGTEPPACRARRHAAARSARRSSRRPCSRPRARSARP